MKRRLDFLAAVAAVFALCNTAHAEEFHWQGVLKPGTTLEIKGVNGGIDATPATGAQAEVVAQKRGRKDDPSDVRIEVIEHTGGVTVCAVYPGQKNECAAGERGRLSARHNDVVVDFEVRVPDGVVFAGKTVNGKVRAMDLDADVALESVNGTIRVSTAGAARATTVNGSIEAVLGRAEWTEPVSFTTVNGGIHVDLPSDAAANVHARTTNGQIDTDFPLTVQGRFTNKSVDGQIGGGGGELELETVNGGIRLSKR